MGCIGMGQAPANGSNSLRTMPRNFPGRSGTREDSVYLCSPETAAAAALTGTITDPRHLTELFDLAYPELELPAVSSVNLTMLEKPLPPEEASEVTLVKGENISSLPVFGPLTDRIEAPVALVMGDDISTDEILPAGARVLPYRSNIPKLAAFTFDQIDGTYPARAARTRDTSGHIVVAGANYGQGSSREHAAITPRFLGLRAVMAVSFARIHWQNLANFGVLALEFTNAADRDRIQQGDVLLLTGLRDALVTGTEILVHNESRDEVYSVRHGLSTRQVQMVLAGGLIPRLRDRRARDAQMNSKQSLP
jgi:aconitate hydratase